MSLRLPASAVRSLLRKLIGAGLHAADPYDALLRSVSFADPILHIGRKRYDIGRYRRVVAVGAGKASARMAQALEHVLGSRLTGGLVVIKTGQNVRTRRITLVEASHPIPDRAGLLAARQVQEMVAGLTASDLLIVLLSGGASSLLPAPVHGVSLSAKQRTTRLLLASGAPIQDMNVVRKHLSRLKGGGLAACTQATIATLVLSDVIGDDLCSIASGLTAADPTTFTDAIGVLKRYAIWRDVPECVREYLLQGRRGLVPETLKPGAKRLRHVQHTIIGNNREMLKAVTTVARQAGLRATLLTTTLTGEAQNAVRQYALLARRIASGRHRLKRPCCVVGGGETTVTVTGRGIGGRAQEFAAAGALEIAGMPNVWIAALGTDGSDGPTAMAGALVGGDTVARAKSIGVDLAAALQRHNTYPALKALHCHIYTGPTGTNVNDLYLLFLL